MRPRQDCRIGKGGERCSSSDPGRRVAHESGGGGQLGSQLASHPQDVAARTRLISYYYQQMIAEPRTRHILWLIETIPRPRSFGSLRRDVVEVAWHRLNSAADRDKARALWLRQSERFSSDTAVLVNAAQALR